MNWISVFLYNRSQKVIVDGEESDSVPVTSGVPQGSVLGPVLFLVYINDHPQNLISHVQLFTDDTAVYLTINNKHDCKELQNDLDKLQVWGKLWNMHFNS